METTKKDIRTLTKDQLRDFFEQQGDKAFRGNQVYEWLWSKGAHTFDDMTNVSKDTRHARKQFCYQSHQGRYDAKKQ